MFINGSIKRVMIDVFGIRSSADFNEACMEVFGLQAKCCAVYKEYIGLLGIDPSKVHNPEEIPMLPIKLFKSRQVVTSGSIGNLPDGVAPVLPDSDFDAVFTSSATTGMIPSRHFVKDISIYEQSFFEGFRLFYGNPRDYVILALLPSYLEREGSSLVYMTEKLVGQASGGGFYLYDHESLYKKLTQLKKDNRKTILIGVTFALLDFVEKFKLDFPELIVIETGGMKGRGVEIPREELHKRLCNGFAVKKIHSEYGMAELLSQAYSKGDGLFSTPPWMQIQISDMYGSFSRLPLNAGVQGRINIIDLANINSCSFIETEDIGKQYPNNTFTIDGRLKNSELRGCNMLLG